MLTKEAYKKLVEELVLANVSYRKGESVMTDDVYDSKYRMVERFEQTFPKDKLLVSITDIMGVRGSVKLNYAMYSMTDVFSLENLYKWMSKFNNYFIAEAKFDGAAMDVEVKNGEIVHLYTRGDGEKGEPIITSLIYKIQNLYPVKGNANIHGEVLVRKKDFFNVNRLRRSKGLKPYSNPRSMVSGLLGRNSITAEHDYLFFMPYRLHADKLESTNTIIAREITLAEAGYITPGYHMTKDPKSILKYIEKFDKERESYEFATDGIVVNMPEQAVIDELGYTGKYPNFCMAYKYKAEEFTTTIVNVHFQPGRTGIYTPVAEVVPVEIDGTIVTRASLSNMEFIERNDIQINDTAVIIKAGEIIPKLLQTVHNENSVIVSPQTRCFCGTELTRVGMDVKCESDRCFVKFNKLVEYHVSRGIMNIKDFGPAVTEKLTEKGLIKTLVDIYRLDLNALKDLLGDGMGVKLFNNINSVKKSPRYLVLAGLGIPRVGRRSSKKILEVCKGDVKLIPELELQLTKSVGSVTTKSMLEYYEKNSDMILELLAITESTYELETTYLKKVAITGKFDASRSMLEKQFNLRGYELAPRVSKDIEFLIAKESNGAKYKRAIALNIPVITLDEMLKFKVKG